jgi:hypothetical protein
MVLEDIIMNDWQEHPILTRADGSYVITYNGYPYHVTAEDDMYAAVTDWITAHPGQASPEPVQELSVEEQQAQFRKYIGWQVTKRLNQFVVTRDYDSILTACSYAGSADPSFAAEGQYCIEARDATWEVVRGIFQAVENGQRAFPASWEEIEAELPALAWPA